MEWLITNTIEAFLLTYFITTLLDMKTRRINICRILMIVIEVCTIMVATYFYIYGIELVVIFFVVKCILSYILSYNSMSEITFVLMLEMVYSLMIQILMIFLNNIYPLQYFNLAVYILYFLCGIIFLKYIKKVQMSFYQLHYYILTSTLMCLYLLGQQLITNYEIIKDNFNQLNTTFVLLLFIIFIFITNFLFLIHDKEEYEKLKQKKKNEDIISHLLDQLKMIKHDLKHDYQLINYYLEQKDYRKIKELTNYQYESIDLIPVFIKSNNSLINNIINNKIIEADMKNIKVRCFVNVPETLRIHDCHLNELISNILDNAIENCPKSGNITINILYEHQILHINIENSINFNFDDKLKTKKNKRYHGYGLRIIRKIASKYHGDIDIKYNDNKFNIQVSLYIS